MVTKGFTLIETLVTAVIIGIVAAIRRSLALRGQPEAGAARSLPLI